MAGYYQYTTEQWLKGSLDEVWDFMSSPKNLKKITPPHMGFEITTDDKVLDKMYQGMIVGYKVSPILGLKMNWLTEITHVVDKKFFVDEQRVGPYKIWHHEHHLEESDSGVMMKDIITYVPPFGFLGRIANEMFIKKQIDQIFSHRFKVLEKIFNE
ncbi:MAG: SRPBCC family protein [Bacteroidetes bacterium]|nr:SRPBCC family protein [Bacteroidota bacterium]